MRTLRFLTLAFGMHVNVGCVLIFGDGSGSSGGQGETCQSPTLPPPEVVRVEQVELTAEQARKKCETDVFTRDVIYKGRPIVKTVQGYSGTIYDYMKIEPLGIEVPDVVGSLPGEPADGIQLGLTEVQNYAELLGPVDTTVFTRPDFSKYIMTDSGATSVQDWVQNYQVPGLPESAYRLYAGLDMPVANRGIHARINMFKPEVVQGSMSVIQLAVACPAEGTPEEFLGVLLSVDRANLGADQLTPAPHPVRLHVEYREMVNGKYEGSFDMGRGDFEPWDVRLTDVGGPLEHVSVAGSDQWEHALMLLMTPTGDWVVLYNYQYIGAFRADHLKMLQKGACRAHIYGEVFNPTPEQGWVATEMGSGQFSGAPTGSVAWARQIRYFDPNYFPVEPSNDDPALWSKPYHPPCYDRQPLSFQGSAGPLMTFGGPGGKDPTCAAKMP